MKHFFNFLTIVCIAFLIFQSCSPTTNKTSLPIDQQIPFSEAGSQELKNQWWKAFNDEQLNLLVDSALAQNFDLAVAYQRLIAANAIVDRESASFLPTLEGTARGEISKPQRAFEDFQQNRSVQIGFSSSYELDLWGRIKAQVQAQRYIAEATRADYQAAAISIIAEVARTWYQLLAANLQLQIIEDQISTNSKVLNLIKNRFGGGQIRSVDILRQEQLLKATREQKYYQETDIALLENQLQVLLGEEPQNKINYTEAPLPSLPPMPATGVPVSLVQRRPDVQNAFYQLQAADRELAAAISNKYPRLSINLSTTTAQNDTDQIFRNWAYAIGGNLLAPIFYGGELNAEVDRAEAVKNQRVYNYGQVVLLAFREVEDALVQEKKQIEAVTLISEQLEISRTAYKQLQLEYLNGLSDYLDVLVALDELQQLERDLVNARLTLFEYRIALYRALAGNFKFENPDF